jgi:hypothetical protein
MILKDIIKTELLNESRFHSINQSMTFTYDLYHNPHSQYRKGRHGSGNRITDYDIITLLNNAKEEITYFIIDGKIKHKKRFVVSDMSNSYLNLIIEPERLNITHWNLVVITLMNKPHFTVSKGQLQLFI